MPNLKKISLGRYSYTFSSSKKSDSDRNVKFLALTYLCLNKEEEKNSL